jgi:hypothetical protein
VVNVEGPLIAAVAILVEHVCEADPVQVTCGSTSEDYRQVSAGGAKDGKLQK